MATPGKLKDDFLTCSICMEVFQQPATLACQHSYCQNCLTKYLQTQPEALTTKSIPCPSCRQHTPVPHPDRPVEEWVGQLKPRLLLTGLMDSCIHETKQCSWCKEEGETTLATHLCLECDDVICDNCLRMHKKIPAFRQHEVAPLSGNENKIRLKKKFVCKEHDEKMKLFCKDCNKPLCTVCCSISHRMCKDVVTSQAMLPEVKLQLKQRQKKITDQIDDNNNEINDFQIKLDAISANCSFVKSEVIQTFQNIVESLNEKQAQLIQKLDDLTEQQTEQVKTKMKSKKMDVETYQQQSEFIKHALKLEDEAQLYEIYLSSGPGAETDVSVTQRQDRFDVADIKFIHDLEKLREDIEKMDINITDDIIDLTSTPKLHEVIETKIDESDMYNLRDVVVVKIKDTKVTVVTDFSRYGIKSFYTKIGEPHFSQLVVENLPWSISVLNEGILAVSVPHAKKIIKVSVDPELKLLSTITTDKQYFGLDVLDQSTLVACTDSPPSVDILDMEGRVLRSIRTLPAPHKSFKYPHYLHVTRQGTILVSDWGLKSVICLTQTGDVVFTYSPTGERALKYPHGITSTSTGDILVADWGTHKVIHLSKSGEFIKDILTLQDGIQQPFGLCIGGNKLYVTVCSKSVHVYQLSQSLSNMKEQLR